MPAARSNKGPSPLSRKHFSIQALESSRVFHSCDSIFSEICVKQNEEAWLWVFITLTKENAGIRMGTKT